MLPDFNGYESARFSNRPGHKPDSAGHRHRPDRRREPYREFCLGADDYIAKPYTPDRIYEAVDQAVRWSTRAVREQSRARSPSTTPTTARSSAAWGSFFAVSCSGRTTLGLETVVQMGRAIKEVWCLADEWARGYAEDHITILTYTHFPAVDPRIPRTRGLAESVKILIKDPVSEISPGSTRQPSSGFGPLGQVCQGLLRDLKEQPLKRG